VATSSDGVGGPLSAVPIGRAEALRLMAGVAYGRVVFTRDALPAIRPVNHLITEDGTIAIRTRLTSRLTSTVRGDADVVVAYETDDIDPVLHSGWSVVVTGIARTVTDPDRLARYEHMLRPWVDQLMDIVVEIEPTIVDGIRLVPAPTGPVTSPLP
jgi:hypothetical protein